MRKDEGNITDDLIRSINETIVIAIFHGGDPGGAYYIFPNRLGKSMDILAKKLGTTWEWDNPKRKHFPMLKCRDENFCKIPEWASTDEKGEEGL